MAHPGRVARLAVAIIVLATAALTAHATPARADYGNPIYLIVNVHSNKCLDVENWSTDNGARVQQWECHGGTNQQWEEVSSSLGGFRLVSVNSRKCLDVQGLSKDDGARIQQWDCWVPGSNQRWDYWSAEWSGNPRALINKNSNRCLDVYNWATYNGAYITQWACHFGDNQLWRFVWVA